MFYTAERFVDELLKKGWTPERLISALEKLETSLTSSEGNDDITTTKEPEADAALKRRIVNFLLEIGIPTHIKGFNYLTSAILLEMKKPSDKRIQVTKYLYPTIAEEYATTSSKVERAIRHAIDHCCNGTNSKIIELAGSIMRNNYKLENYKFITFAAIYLKQQ